jgi:hypothetical protein
LTVNNRTGKENVSDFAQNLKKQKRCREQETLEGCHTEN